MSISEKQREAARLNGAKSRGPTTPAGKRASARNSTKHGMSGDGCILPEGMQDEVAAELEIFNRKFRPRDYHEQRLVEHAALTQVRKNRLLRAELLWTADRARLALERHDEARAAEVAEFAALLPSDPAAALEGLRRTTEGCDWLADAWDDLAATLARAGSWNFNQCRRAVALLGYVAAPDPHLEPEGARLVRLADDLRAVVEVRESAKRIGADPAERLAKFPDPVATLDELSRLVAERIAGLEARAAELWERRDRPRRDAAPDLALFDPGPEFARLIRYLADADRQQRRALADLERLRRLNSPDRRSAPPPPPIEPDPAPEPRPASEPRLESRFASNAPTRTPCAIDPSPLPLAAPSESARNEPGAPAHHPLL